MNLKQTKLFFDFCPSLEIWVKPKKWKHFIILICGYLFLFFDSTYFRSFGQKSKNVFNKGQLISKTIYGLLTFPKKRTVEFVLFAFYPSYKSNSSVRFLGESMACQSTFWFYLTFRQNLVKIYSMDIDISCFKSAFHHIYWIGRCKMKS